MYGYYLTQHGAADMPCVVANTTTFTAFTSFSENFENFSKCFLLFEGQKNIFSKSAQKIVKYPKK